jgi:predicted transcriptional regulator
MPLTRFERKERLPYGEQQNIAREAGVSEAFVSRVQNDKIEGLDPDKVRQVQLEIAKRLRPRVPLAEAFPKLAA